MDLLGDAMHGLVPPDEAIGLLEQMLGRIPAAKEIEVLQEFLFQLTVACRCVGGAEGSKGQLAGEELITAYRGINEINHRVLNRIRATKTGDESFAPDYVERMVLHHARHVPSIAGYVAWALDRALAKHTP
jgi:hypothetical protein